MTDKCNICWSTSSKLYNMCLVCTSGSTCKKCIKKSITLNSISMRCPMCRSLAKVPDMLLIKLSLLSRVVLLLRILLFDMITNVAVKWNSVTNQNNQHNQQHISMFFSSIATMILINLVFYNMCWIWFYHTYRLTFFMSNIVIIMAFAVYYYLFIGDIRLNTINIIGMYTSSMSIVTLYPHLLTLSMQIIDSNSYTNSNNLIYGVAYVGVCNLSVALLIVLVALMGCLYDRWINTGYRYSLERFLKT